MKLAYPLPPGYYAWSVVAAAADNAKGSSAMSAARYFTVQGPTLTHLRVRSASHRGANYNYPGYSLLKVLSTPYTKIRVAYSVGRHTTIRTMYMGDNSEADLRVNWRCARPAARIPYTVTVSDDQGHRLTRHAVAHGVTASTCSRLHATMVAAQQARLRAQWLAWLRQQQQLAAQQRREINRFKTNCRAIGGTPKLLTNSDGSQSWYCVAPYGGLLNPPGGPWG